MRLLMLSWRYLDHPQAGGAEIVTHEMLKRAVQRGWEVTCFTATYPGSAPTGEIDGVRIVRGGVQWSVHAHAFRWLRTRLGEFDRVVEQINTLPFLTPLYVPRPKRRLLIHQLAREYWFRETRGLFRLAAPFGYALEPWQTRLYRRTPAITISQSSKRDLERYGVPVTAVIPMAVYTEPVAALAPRTPPFRVVSIGRLTPAKFVEEAVEAFAILQARVPEAVFDIGGGGDPVYRERLEGIVRERGLRGVTFHGRIEEAAKTALLEDAHVHLFSSHREGWGLTVSEAGMRGTPTVGYDAPGVRDSVVDAELLAPIGSVAGLAERMQRLHEDPALYDRLRSAAWERARQLNFDRTADVFMEAVA